MIGSDKKYNMQIKYDMKITNAVYIPKPMSRGEDMCFASTYCDSILLTVPSSTFGWWIAYLMDRKPATPEKEANATLKLMAADNQKRIFLWKFIEYTKWTDPVSTQSKYALKSRRPRIQSKTVKPHSFITNAMEMAAITSPNTALFILYRYAAVFPTLKDMSLKNTTINEVWEDELPSLVESVGQHDTHYWRDNFTEDVVPPSNLFAIHVRQGCHPCASTQEKDTQKTTILETDLEKTSGPELEVLTCNWSNLHDYLYFAMFQCAECYLNAQKYYSTLDELEIHLAIDHYKLIIYECFCVPMLSSTESTLVDHYRYTHSITSAMKINYTLDPSTIEIRHEIHAVLVKVLLLVSLSFSLASIQQLDQSSLPWLNAIPIYFLIVVRPINKELVVSQMLVPSHVAAVGDVAHRKNFKLLFAKKYAKNQKPINAATICKA
uniref:C2H2-type domain-containing protein n=1 Tax=Ditylenchus dipsaci TaxID=166011 RepID=A0A915EPL8_9BILA